MKILTRALLSIVIALAAFIASPVPGAVHGPFAVAAAAQQKVVFNTRSHKYHCASCPAAVRCTRNCIVITLADAKARGGVPCKICGGTCRVR